MKIECTKSKLAEAVAKAEKITGKNLTLPVLSCILIEAKGRS
jgi:DNA polymerase III sliding clamp (beta) subunit (PCNA family)